MLGMLSTAARSGCYNAAMTELASRLKNRCFGDQEHPYRTFEREVEKFLNPDVTLLDAGCGYTAPVLSKYVSRAKRLIGVDLVDFTLEVQGIELLNQDLAHVELPASSVDLIISRSVMEHVADPKAVYTEMYRLLRPGGHIIFLTANLWDYASIIARIVPNRFHPWIVSRTEGRNEEDVFPIQYRTNTRRAVCKWAQECGFDIKLFRYLGQYPSYFLFNGGLFLMATVYEKLISRFSGLAFLRGWILVILHKPAPITTAKG